MPQPEPLPGSVDETVEWPRTDVRLVVRNLTMNRFRVRLWDGGSFEAQDIVGAGQPAVNIGLVIAGIVSP